MRLPPVNVGLAQGKTLFRALKALRLFLPGNGNFGLGQRLGTGTQGAQQRVAKAQLRAITSVVDPVLGGVQLPVVAAINATEHRPAPLGIPVAALRFKPLLIRPGRTDHGSIRHVLEQLLQSDSRGCRHKACQ